MVDDRTIIVDLTRETAHICVTAAGSAANAAMREFAIPYRVAVIEEEKELRMLAGAAVADLHEDSHTIIFDNLHTELLRIEDTALQSELVTAFWLEVCRKLLDEGRLDNSVPPCSGYVIPHYLTPPALLEHFRATCAGAPPLKVAGFCSEACSLVMGFLQSARFTEALDALDCSSPRTVCLAVAEDDRELAVACFDYSMGAGGRISILLRDYFRSAYADLSARLKDSDWLSRFSVLIALESPELTPLSKDLLDAAIGAISINIVKEQYQAAGLSELKTRGAATLAGLCSMRGDERGEYRIETACRIGVRLNRSNFHPIIAKEEFEHIVDFPYSALQTFKLRGRPGNEMRIQLYCGSSDRIEDSTQLGHLTLSQAELVSLMAGDDAAVVAVVRLDAPGGGEFTLGLLPDNRIIGSQTFTLPGLMV